MADIWNLNTWNPSAQYLSPDQRQASSTQGWLNMATALANASAPQKFGTPPATLAQILTQGAQGFGQGANNYTEQMAKMYEPYQQMQDDKKMDDYIAQNPNASEQLMGVKGLPLTRKMVESMAANRGAMNLAMMYQPQLKAAEAAATLPIKREEKRLADQEELERTGTPVTDENTGENVYIGKTTEDNNKAYGFTKRLMEANTKIDMHGAANLEAGENAKNLLPDWAANANHSNEYQLLDQATREFINAQLRRDSGATILPSELSDAKKQYIPVYGDKPDVLAQKKANRETAIDAMKTSSGPFSRTFKSKITSGALSLDDPGFNPQKVDASQFLPQINAKDLSLAGPPPGRPKALGRKADDQVPEGIDPAEWKHLTPEERALWR